MDQEQDSTVTALDLSAMQESDLDQVARKLSLLPELDRQLLEEGIPARDDAELQSLLEDLRE